MQLIAEQRAGQAGALAKQSRVCFEVGQALAKQLGAGSLKRELYCSPKPCGRRCVIVFGADRALAGSYQSRLLSCALTQLRPSDLLLPVGKKTTARLAAQPVLTSAYEQASTQTSRSCFAMAQKLHESYRMGEIDGVVLIFTRPVSALRQEPVAVPLLPVAPSDTETTLWEAQMEEVALEYLGLSLSAAMNQARASEYAARRNAMDQATKNADELIDALHLRYHRQRQNAITRQLTELFSGAEEEWIQ